MKVKNKTEIKNIIKLRFAGVCMERDVKLLQSVVMSPPHSGDEVAWLGFSRYAYGLFRRRARHNLPTPRQEVMHKESQGYVGPFWVSNIVYDQQKKCIVLGLTEPFDAYLLYYYFVDSTTQIPLGFTSLSRCQDQNCICNLFRPLATFCFCSDVLGAPSGRSKFVQDT